MNHHEGRLARADEPSTEPSSLAPDEYYRISLQLLQSGDLAQAEINCSEALETYADHANLLHLMGTVSLLSKNYDAAVEWNSRREYGGSVA